VYFLTVPNNLRDWIPSDKDYFDLAEIRGLISNKSYDRALSLLGDEDHPDNSLNLFYIAKVYDAKGDFNKARHYYIHAKDMDKDFLRTRSQWNELIRNIKEPNTRIIDMENIMFGYSKDGIPGYDLFHDFVHMRIQGYQYMGYEIAKQIMEDFFPLNKERLKQVRLSYVPGSELRKLYILKAINWLRSKYYSANDYIMDMNTENVIRNYWLDTQYIDKTIKLLDQEDD